MGRYVRLYRLFVKYSLMRAMMYKEDFLIWSAVMVGWFILTIIFYQVLFANVSEVAGWTKAELLILQGYYFVFDFILWGVLWPNMKQLPIKINKGELDYDLIRPISAQFMLSFRELDLDNANEVILGVATIIYGLRLGQIHPGVVETLLAIMTVVAAIVFIYAFYFISICIAFWFDRIENLHYVFPSFRHLWKQPQSFYSGWLRWILTIIVPITLVTTLPTEWLLMRLPWKETIFLIVFSLVALWFSRWFFKVALRRYSSASS